MKTTFIPQIVVAAIFSLAMTRTFATPMPTAVRTSPDDPSYIYPRKDDVPLTNHVHDHHRDIGAAPIHAVLRSVKELREPIRQIAIRLRETNPQHDADIETTSELVQSTLALHDVLTGLLFLVTRVIVTTGQGVEMSTSSIAKLLQRHDELGITDEKGTPLIRYLITIVEGVVMQDLEGGGEEDIHYHALSLTWINRILELSLGWEVMHDLRRVRLALATKLRTKGVSALEIGV
ncbi:hypothetical protein H0H93_007187 [Arthromyces matolae]|nr:hypothetical protein H0H93_007187 [Arthromyces matolae]